MSPQKDTQQKVSGSFRKDSPNRLYRLKEVAEILNVHVTTLHNWIKRGRLVPRRTPGNSPFLTIADIEALARGKQ